MLRLKRRRAGWEALRAWADDQLVSETPFPRPALIETCQLFTSQPRNPRRCRLWDFIFSYPFSSPNCCTIRFSVIDQEHTSKWTNPSARRNVNGSWTAMRWSWVINRASHSPNQRRRRQLHWLQPPRQIRNILHIHQAFPLKQGSANLQRPTQLPLVRSDF